MLRRKRILALGFISIFYFSLVFPPFNSFEVDAFPESFFSISILVPNNNIELGQIAILLSSMLPRIGIGVNTVDIVDIGTVYNRTYNHPGPFPIPPHASGGYDIVLLEQKSEIEYNAEEYFHSTSFPPNGKNIYQFYKPELDWAIGNYSEDYDYAHRKQNAEDIQAILYEEVPSVPIVYTEGIILTNENFIKSSMDGVLWSFAYQQMTNWSIPGQTELHYAVPRNFENMHPYFSESHTDNQWLNQIYTGLVERTNEFFVKGIYSQFGNYIDIDSADGYTYQVYIDPDAKWADGHVFNASDIKYSYDLIINPDLNQPNYDFYSQYIDNTSVTINSEFELSINFKQSDIFTINNLALDILPKHIWESILPSEINSTAEIWATTQPEKIFGIGPYKLHSLDSTDGYVHLTRNEYYKNWTGVTPYFEDIYFDYYNNKEDVLDDLNSSKLDMVDIDFNFYPNNITSDFESIAIEKPITYELAINCLHPYIGTGELAPIASDDSARYIRQAINHAIPKNLIIFEMLGGLGNPGITIYPNIAIGFDDELIPYEFWIDYARQKMEAAGFVYPVSYTYDPFPIWPCALIFTAIGIVALFVLLLIVVFISTFTKDTIEWTKKEIKKRKSKEKEE